MNIFSIKMETNDSNTALKASTSSGNISSLPVAVRSGPPVRLPNFKGQKRAELDDLLLQVLHEENIPISFLENEFFREFITKLNKTYRIPQLTDPPHNITGKSVENRPGRVMRRAPKILRHAAIGPPAYNYSTNYPASTTFTGAARPISPPHLPIPISSAVPIPMASSSSYSAPLISKAKKPSQIFRLNDSSTTLPPTAIPAAQQQQQSYKGSTLSNAMSRYKSEVRTAIDAAEYVMLSAKCYRLCATNKRVLGHLVCVFAYTPQPYLVAQLKRTSQVETASFHKRLALFVGNLISDIGRDKIVALITDHSDYCADFAFALMEKCSWIVVEKDNVREQERHDALPSSTLLPLMNPALKPAFNEKALKILSEKVSKHPSFRGSRLMVDWAHWIARTGIYASDQRDYAWTSETMNSMDAFTWWNGFFADTLLARLYAMMNVINTSLPKIRNSWTLVEQLITNETKQIKSFDLEEISKAVYIRFNRRDHSGRHAIFAPIED